jgi:hypothetical protein
MTDPDVLTDETEYAEPETMEQTNKVPFWKRWFKSQHISIQEALFELDDAITQHPESPTNYLLRGEYYLQIGYNQLAEQDLQQAVLLAEAELAKRDWGLVAQAVRDRARQRLAQSRA